MLSFREANLTSGAAEEATLARDASYGARQTHVGSRGAALSDDSIPLDLADLS
jgi:hypothetical protein